MHVLGSSPRRGRAGGSQPTDVFLSPVFSFSFPLPFSLKSTETYFPKHSSGGGDPCFFGVCAVEAEDIALTLVGASVTGHGNRPREHTRQLLRVHLHPKMLNDTATTSPRGRAHVPVSFASGTTQADPQVLLGSPARHPDPEAAGRSVLYLHPQVLPERRIHARLCSYAAQTGAALLCVYVPVQFTPAHLLSGIEALQAPTTTSPCNGPSSCGEQVPTTYP